MDTATRNKVLQGEVNRLRKVLHKISDSTPHEIMDIDKNPALVEWICDTCRDARLGAYPTNTNEPHTN